VLVRITLDSQNDEALQGFEATVGKCHWVTQCALTSGSDDYLLTVVARDVADFERIHKTQLSTLPRVARI
jgi:Lrp/AsnC family transcriptional regulator, leucine-responsive regulatory protein